MHGVRMANILHRPSWFVPEARVTPESVFFKRREFIKALGFAGAGLSAQAIGVGTGWAAEATPTVGGNAATKGKAKYPATRSSKFNPGWTLTEEEVATKYNNFYEFTLVKNRVHQMVDRFVIQPWKIEVGGLVEKTTTLDAHELIAQMDLEERVYRFRCVEAWAMIVPWTGFPLSRLIERVQPKPEAKFIRFETFNRPDQAPGMRDPGYPWPYFEGLRMDEAMHPLTFLATGIYGKPMPKQHGAPIRLVVPWKYGYKSIKSISKIEFLAEQPKTFWEALNPKEYPFESNVNPGVPHPRWSQATERMIDTGDRVRTQIYNGYGAEVSKLYPKA